MEKNKTDITFFKKHKDLSKALEAALKNVSKKLIEETKKKTAI